MRRRQFLKLSVGAVGLAGVPAIAIAQQPSLRRACRAGAERLGVPWSPTLSNRVHEELAEFRHASAEGGIIRIASVVRELKAQSVQFAPAWGRTGSSAVAWLLGLSEIDPLRYGITFDAVRYPRTQGRKPTASLCLAIENRSLKVLLSKLCPSRMSSDESFRGYPKMWDAEVEGVSCVFAPIHERELDLPLSYQGYLFGRLAKPFERYLSTYVPKDERDLAVALAIFRPGPAQSGMAEEVCRTRRFGQDPIPTALEDEHIGRLGPKETHGWLIYREDILRACMFNLGLSRVEGARYLATASRKDAAEVGRVKALHMERARSQGLNPVRARTTLQWIHWFAGYSCSKAHALSLALMILGGNPSAKRWAIGTHTAAMEGNVDWAWEMVEAAQGRLTRWQQSEM